MIADVSGHGASSAFVTVLLKNLTARLRSAYGRDQDESILSPALLLSKANDELLETDLGKHITMFVACLDARTNSMVYSNAGHLPCPILSVNGKAAEYIQLDGMPVGIAPSADYEEATLQLPESFTLALFTDGILELLEEEELLDKEAALLGLCEHAVADTASLVTRLGLDDVEAAPDDIAVFTVTKS